MTMPPKIVLITGCGPDGIGAALAKEFHLRGQVVFASGRTADEIDASLLDLGVKTLVLDVTSQQSIDTAAATISGETAGRLDILINNAGIFHALPFADTPIDTVKRIYDVNFFGVWAVTQAFLPLLLEAQGMVVHMGSINAVMCPPYLSIYSSGKAAVEALGRTMRRELAPLGVKVVTLKTGSVASSLSRNAYPATVPEGSYYRAAKAYIEEHRFFEAARFISADVYARAVVSDLLKPSVSAVIWRGGLTTVAWVLSWLGWETMLDAAMIKGSQLDTAKYHPKAL